MAPARSTQARRPPAKKYNTRFIRLLIVVFIVGIALGLLVGNMVWGKAGTASGFEGETTTTSSSPGSASVGSTTGTAGTAGATAVSDAQLLAENLAANELGLIPVLEYHCIEADTPEDELHRTPEHFRADIALLKAQDFYPITAREMAAGTIDIPAGKSPVVITFDDSSPSQYRILSDGSIDPDCAVGILVAASEDGAWAPKASFFPLLYVNPPDNILWGQPDYQEQKLTYLVGLGCEIGSHTRTHADLKAASLERCHEELARSQSTLNEMIGNGYNVTTICVPFGSYPTDESILASGDYDGQSYTYSAALQATGGLSPSPFSSRFETMRIKRIVVAGSAIDDFLTHFEENPDQRYVSDGDPSVISIPQQLSEDLGALGTDFGLPVVTY